ncbi:hypothetical protein ABPG74_020701 [Tetrahymena malaccensis]
MTKILALSQALLKTITTVFDSTYMSQNILNLSDLSCHNSLEDSINGQMFSQKDSSQQQYIFQIKSNIHKKLLSLEQLPEYDTQDALLKQHLMQVRLEEQAVKFEETLLEYQAVQKLRDICLIKSSNYIYVLIPISQKNEQKLVQFILDNALKSYKEQDIYFIHYFKGLKSVHEYNLIVKATTQKYPLKQVQQSYVPHYIANNQSEIIYYHDLRHNRAYHFFLAEVQNKSFQQINEPTLIKLRKSPSIFSHSINFINSFTECLNNENNKNQKYFIRGLITNSNKEKAYQVVLYLAGQIIIKSQKIVKEKGNKILVIKYQNDLTKYGLDGVEKDQCGKNVLHFNIPVDEQEIKITIQKNEITKLKDINYQNQNKELDFQILLDQLDDLKNIPLILKNDQFKQIMNSKVRFFIGSFIGFPNSAGQSCFSKIFQVLLKKIYNNLWRYVNFYFKEGQEIDYQTLQ